MAPFWKPGCAKPGFCLPRQGRAAIGDQMIGQVLAHAPADEDGTWPCLPVRELIEFTRSKDLEVGIQTGVYNMRGVTTRSPTDGGTKNATSRLAIAIGARRRG